MKKLALAALAATTLLASPAAAQTWTGFYIGVHGGYATGDSDQVGTPSGRWVTHEPVALLNEVNAFIDWDLEPNGFVYGGQIGYNLETGPVVVGVEADFTMFDVDDSAVRDLTTACCAPLDYIATSAVDVDYMYSARVKVGVPFGNTLVYVHGGWARMKADYFAAIESPFNGYDKAGGITETTDGYIVGAGIEQKLGANISVRAEYGYTDQGSVTFTNLYLPGSTFNTPGSPYTETYIQDVKMHLFRLGFNFHF